MQSFFHWLQQHLEWADQLVGRQDILAPLLLLFAEETGVPTIIPGDAILAYTGYSISQHHGTSIWIALGVAIISILCGASVLFFIARRWGQPVIRKLAKFLFIKESHLERTEKLFAKYGVWAIIIGRHIPGIRAPITIFAATSGVSYPAFISSVFITTILWALFYLHLGLRYGVDIQHTVSKSIVVSVSAFAVVIILIVGLHFFLSYRRRRKI